MEVNINDMLVKTRDELHQHHLQESFDVMKNFGMKLNLDKFVFMVESEKILSYIVSQRGIDVNLV